jgi:hypothetical protein
MELSAPLTVVTNWAAEVRREVKMQNELDILREVSDRLESAGIAFMLTGSVAMNYYAQPRMTRDIDLVAALRETDVEAFAQLRIVRCSISSITRASSRSISFCSKPTLIVRKSLRGGNARRPRTGLKPGVGPARARTTTTGIATVQLRLALNDFERKTEMKFVKKEQQIIKVGRYYFEIDPEAGTYSYRAVQLAGGALPGYSRRRDAAIELMGYRATEPRDADKLLRAVGDDLFAEEAKENYHRISHHPDKTWSIDYLASRLADEIEWAIECLPMWLLLIKMPWLETRDVEVFLSGDVAFAHFLSHVSGTQKTGQKVEMWFRTTLGFERKGADGGSCMSMDRSHSIPRAAKCPSASILKGRRHE